MRYDRGIYRDCRFCQGRGCLACPGEAERAYQVEFPHGPEPVITVPIDEGTFDAKAMASLVETLGRKALEGAFAPGGGGLRGLIEQMKDHGQQRSQAED